MTVLIEREKTEQKQNLLNNGSKGEVIKMSIIHYRFTDSIDDFVKSLSLPKVAYSILKSRKDCEVFAKSYWMNNPYIIDDLLDFREYKIESENITYAEFLTKCIRLGFKRTFEDFFMQEFTSNDMLLIHESIKDEKTSLEMLYINFNKNPNINIMKYII